MVLFPLMNVKAPSNFGKAQHIIMLLCTFEVIPGEFWKDYIWNWTEKEELSKKLEYTGLDSRIFMLSMGMPFYIFALSLPFLLVAIALTYCYCRRD